MLLNILYLQHVEYKYFTFQKKVPRCFQWKRGLAYGFPCSERAAEISLGQALSAVPEENAAIYLRLRGVLEGLDSTQTMGEAFNEFRKGATCCPFVASRVAS